VDARDFFLKRRVLEKKLDVLVPELFETEIRELLDIADTPDPLHDFGGQGLHDIFAVLLELGGNVVAEVGALDVLFEVDGRVFRGVRAESGDGDRSDDADDMIENIRIYRDDAVELCSPAA